MPFISSSALDAGLNYIKNNATTIHICSAEPTSYSNVSSVSLGNATSITVSNPTNAPGGARKITVGPITGGVITATGTATHYALVSASELLSVGVLSASQGVSSGGNFNLTAFDIVFQQPT